ncbi:Oxygen regulatory protein NreC [Novipirellula aureliae]|uniref:Oxygen regulatory protein NreC n=1 Tax=Novipirellula aureliae TaxID=2527966 RepID=A0A5C6ECT1_9BACT|nr:response regulator transcription factor [Novipirellula aureliae]TWU44999.1 Oxygen regulatory protein NreC [Novipirellula aureliae]
MGTIVSCVLGGQKSGGTYSGEGLDMAKIVIVDDHPISRDGLAMRIEMESDLQVCAEAEGVDDALDSIEKTQPDAAIVDICLKTSNGIELVKEIRSRFPTVRTLVWSMYDESLYAERALKAGASGYINKRYARETMIDALRTVLAGEVYLSPEFLSKRMQEKTSGDSIDDREPAKVLSNRELEVFTLIGRGTKTSQIASAMSLSPNTIETYRSRIKDKLCLRHTAELARFATEWVLANA